MSAPMDPVTLYDQDPEYVADHTQYRLRSTLVMYV